MNPVELALNQPTKAMPFPDDTESFWQKPLPEDEDLKRLVGGTLHIYHCQELLGRGGMGWVYLARHLDLDRVCALKVLSPKLAEQSESYRTMFRDEGRTAAALVHPNIVTTHAIGESDSLHFLELEYIAGRSLRQALAEGPFSPQRALIVAVQLASGLALAHRLGILHRDLKPENVLMTPRGVPKIADFGLARFVDRASTSGEPLMGTPLYMAPELFSGERHSKQSDVYALGVCLFRMLAGELPYKARTMQELVQMTVHGPTPSIRLIRPDVPLEVAECLDAMLSRSPANRPASALEAFELLDAIAGHIRDLRLLMHEALDDLPQVAWKGDKEHFTVDVQLPRGRRQIVYIEPATRDDQTLLSIFSHCAPSAGNYHERALRLNSEMKHGAIAIRDIDGVPSYVMINTYPRSTVDPLEIRRSVQEVAQQADDLEHEITGRDVN
jgi:serine/threonine-protein kinase